MPTYSNSVLMELNETQERNGGVEDGVEEGYDEVDSSNNPARASYQVVSDSTQTEDFDTVDSDSSRTMVNTRIGRGLYQNGLYTNTSNRTGDGDGCRKIVTGGGIFSNLITMVLPMTKKLQNGNHPEEDGLVYSNGTNSRCISTQTEESPVSLKARQLCCWVIQELVLEDPIPSTYRDNVFETLCCCVCEILDKHSILFSGMLRRCEVTNYRAFTSVANEVFQATAEATNFTVTWGRVVSLFAFAVRLAQKYKENEDEEKLDDVIQYLSNYVLKYLLEFVENNEGWDGLVKQFPITDSEDKQMKRAMLLSGLCVGLVATMYAFTK